MRIEINEDIVETIQKSSSEPFFVFMALDILYTVGLFKRSLACQAVIGSALL